MKKRIRMIVSFAVVFSTMTFAGCSIGNTANIANSSDIPPFFKVYLLIPNTAYPSLIYHQIEQNLPKIGIEVETIFAGWTQISPRTWGYPGPYPIPSYNESGYDMLIIGWSWDIEYNPSELFGSPTITPMTDNLYQFFNNEMDIAIDAYNIAYNDTEKIPLMDTMQDILYEELPALAICYPLQIFAHKDGLTGWDAELWLARQQPMENWSIPGQQSLVYATPYNFDVYHPLSVDVASDNFWLNQIYNGLIQRAPETHLWEDRIASSCTTNDFLNWSIKIRPDAVWADGMPITADDVIYSYQLAIDPDLGVADFSRNILYWDNDSFTKINDKELEISFKQKYLFQERNLAVQLLPKHIWSGIEPANHQSQALDWMTANPENIFGAGPYKLKEFNDTGHYICLERNPYFDDWYGITPYFDNITFQFFSTKFGALDHLSNGLVDLVDSQFSPQAEEIAYAGINYTSVKDPGVSEIALNMFHPYFGTGELCPIAGTDSAKYVRKAISHCLDREHYTQNQLYGREGLPAATSVPSLAIGFNESYLPHTLNLSEAMRLMILAGFDYPTNNHSFVVGIPLFVVSTLALSVILIYKRK